MTGIQLNLPGRSTYRPGRSRSKGSILILTLWSISLLVIFALYLGVIVRQRLTLATRLEERYKLRLIAEAGAKRAIIQIVSSMQGGETYDSLTEAWSSDAGLFQDIRVGDGNFSVSYVYVNDKNGNLATRYGAIDEESKLNINTADKIILRNFLKIAAGSSDMDAQEIAASIMDWRDKDSELSLPIGSAEDRDYRSRYYPYEAKDSHFEVLEELLLVNGIDRQIYEDIKRYITVYGDGKININTAEKVVLLSLGLDRRVADMIISFRYGEDNMIGTEDDRVFVSTANIIPALSQYIDMSESEVAVLSRVVEQNFTVASKNFKIRSQAELNGGRMTREVTCIVDRTGRILYWRES